MKLAKALAKTKEALAMYDHSGYLEVAAQDLVDAVEETLLAQKKEADVLLDLAELRR